VSVHIPDDVKRRVRREAGDHCGYCRCRQDYVLWVLEIDHIIPTAQGGTNEEENLWLACRLCNHYKGTQTHGRDPLRGRRVRLFNPRYSVGLATSGGLRTGFASSAARYVAGRRFSRST